MSTKSSIEWTETTWNPLTGCTKISPGCKHCYAERMSKRLQKMGQRNYVNGFDLAIHRHVLPRPLEWKKRQMVFVNSMSDLFQKNVPEEFVFEVFDIMRQAHWHDFQVLTKRSDRLAELNKKIHWPSNIWMGVSVEDKNYCYRIEDLRNTNAAIKFLSLEPLLGPLPNLVLNGIDWVIVGGESGPGARPMQKSWVIEIKNQCSEFGIPFFFKQWGGANKKKTGRLLDGIIWDQMPNRIHSRLVQTQFTL